jgi:hypothetical protein
MTDTDLKPHPNPQGFTDRLEDICEARCAEVGDPACWRLPKLVECKHITPCAECLADRVKELETRADLAPAAVTVKPLRWDKHPDEEEYYGGSQENLVGINEYDIFPNLSAPGLFVLCVMGNRCDEDFRSPDTAKVAAQADYERRILSALTPAPVAAHSDDEAVDRFAVAMKAKLADARAKGRSGWDDPDDCTVEFLADLLRGHIGKGNPGNFEGIANLCMMLHQRGADPSILTPGEQHEVETCSKRGGSEKAND